MAAKKYLVMLGVRCGGLASIAPAGSGNVTIEVVAVLHPTHTADTALLADVLTTIIVTVTYKQSTIPQTKQYSQERPQYFSSIQDTKTECVSIK